MNINEISIKELTGHDVRKYIKSLDGLNSNEMLQENDGVVSVHPEKAVNDYLYELPLKEIMLFVDLTEDDLLELKPSEMALLIERIKVVNPGFFTIAAVMGVMKKAVEQENQKLKDESSFIV
jgi:hypothetical protein